MHANVPVPNPADVEHARATASRSPMLRAVVRVDAAAMAPQQSAAVVREAQDGAACAPAQPRHQNQLALKWEHKRHRISRERLCCCRTAWRWLWRRRRRQWRWMRRRWMRRRRARAARATHTAGSRSPSLRHVRSFEVNASQPFRYLLTMKLPPAFQVRFVSTSYIVVAGLYLAGFGTIPVPVR